MAIFIASDGKKFLNEKALEKYEVKLFATNNFVYIPLEGSGELRPIFHVKDQSSWDKFINYLVVECSPHFKSYSELFLKFKNCYIIIYENPVSIKTIDEYIEELEIKKSNIQKYIDNLRTNNFIGIE